MSTSLNAKELASGRAIHPPAARQAARDQVLHRAWEVSGHLLHCERAPNHPADDIQEDGTKGGGRDRACGGRNGSVRRRGPHGRGGWWCRV